MEYLKHKTADLIMGHDYTTGPVLLFMGRGWQNQMQSLYNYVDGEARRRKCRFSIRFRGGIVVISLKENNNDALDLRVQA